MDDNLDSMFHYGIKGMRWGVRKDRNTSSLSSSSRSSSKSSMTEEERKRQTRARVKKALIIGGAVAVTAATAYVAAKHYDKNFRALTLDTGTKVQNINLFGDKLNLDKITYGTFKKTDSKLYQDKFVDELFSRAATSNTAYKTVLENKTPIKAPSRSQAKKMFDTWKTQENISGKLSYRNYHRSLILGDGSSNKSSFTNFVKSKGYNALLDELDQGGSYKAKKPFLVFDGADVYTSLGSEVIRQTFNL